MPSIQVELILDEKKWSHGREAYTLFTMIGDIGGFNSAITIFPSIVMGWYSSRMFQASMYQDVNIKKKQKSKDKNSLQKKLSSEEPFEG